MRRSVGAPAPWDGATGASPGVPAAALGPAPPPPQICQRPQPPSLVELNRSGGVDALARAVFGSLEARLRRDWRGTCADLAAALQQGNLVADLRGRSHTLARRLLEEPDLRGALVPLTATTKNANGLDDAWLACFDALVLGDVAALGFPGPVAANPLRRQRQRLHYALALLRRAEIAPPELLAHGPLGQPHHPGAVDCVLLASSAAQCEIDAAPLAPGDWSSNLARGVARGRALMRALQPGGPSAPPAASDRVDVG